MIHQEAQASKTTVVPPAAGTLSGCEVGKGCSA